MIDTSLTIQPFQQHAHYRQPQQPWAYLPVQRNVEAPATRRKSADLRCDARLAAMNMPAFAVTQGTPAVRDGSLFDALQEQFGVRRLPRIEGWQLAGRVLAAEKVGGDFYEAIPLPDGRLGVVIGDVAGKGAAAAVIMTMARSILRDYIVAGDAPAQTLARANAALVERMPRGYFVTCFHAVIDLASGAMTFANAGHNLPYLRTDAGVAQIEASGMPLGLMEEIAYDEGSAQIPAGASLLLYTDGVTEARNSASALFGFARLREVIAQLPRAMAPVAVCEVLLNVVAKYTDGQQNDDIALLALHRD